MDTRVEIVDPHASAATASAILLQAWSIPCLHYSAAYLTWQLSFPGDPPPRAVMAFLGDRAVGFAALTPRALKFVDRQFPAYVLSFVAVAPNARGRGLAGAMYDQLLTGVDVPVVVFSEPASTGERLLLEAFARASYFNRSLLPCRTIGFLPRPSTSHPPASARPTDDYAEFLSPSKSQHDSTTIWNCPTLSQWEHYRSDPRGRMMMSIHDAGNRAAGSAMAVGVEIVGHSGLERALMLESVCLATPTGEVLGAAVSFVAARRTPEMAPAILASNLSYLDQATVRAGGGRAIPAGFNAHVFTKDGDSPLRTASALNLEVI